MKDKLIDFLVLFAGLVFGIYHFLNLTYQGSIILGFLLLFWIVICIWSLCYFFMEVLNEKFK